MAWCKQQIVRLLMDKIPQISIAGAVATSNLLVERKERRKVAAMLVQAFDWHMSDMSCPRSFQQLS